MTESVYLSELVDIYLGLTHTPEYVLDGVPFLSVKNISSGSIDFSQCNYITEDEYNSLPNGAKPQCGDMLFCRVGTIGKPVIIEKDTPRFGSFVSLGFFRVKDNSLCKLKYLYYWMYSESFYSQVRKNVKGASQVNLNTGWLKNFKLPLYSLTKQADIVQKLEEVDRLISLRKEQLAKLDQLVKSRFIELFGDQETNPFGWTQCTVGECCTLKSGTSLSAEMENEGGPIPYVKVGDMNYPGNERYITTSSRYVSEATAGKGIFEVGSILFPKRGGAIGTNKKRMTKLPICADLNVMGVSSNGQLLPEYLLAYFDMIDLGALSDGSSVPQINNKNIAPLVICVPPMELQKQFASFVEQTDKSKLAIQESLEKLETLKKALMQKYFG